MLTLATEQELLLKKLCNGNKEKYNTDVKNEESPVFIVTDASGVTQQYNIHDVPILLLKPHRGKLKSLDRLFKQSDRDKISPLLIKRITNGENNVNT